MSKPFTDLLDEYLEAKVLLDRAEEFDSYFHVGAAKQRYNEARDALNEAFDLKGEKSE